MNDDKFELIRSTLLETVRITQVLTMDYYNRSNKSAQVEKLVQETEDLIAKLEQAAPHGTPDAE